MEWQIVMSKSLALSKDVDDDGSLSLERGERRGADCCAPIYFISRERNVDRKKERAKLKLWKTTTSQYVVVMWQICQLGFVRWMHAPSSPLWEGRERPLLSFRLAIIIRRGTKPAATTTTALNIIIPFYRSTPHLFIPVPGAVWVLFVTENCNLIWATRFIGFFGCDWLMVKLISLVVFVCVDFFLLLLVARRGILFWGSDNWRLLLSHTESKEG